MDLRNHTLRMLAMGLVALAVPAFAATNYSESIGISTPQKKVVGTAAGHDTASGPAQADEQMLNKVVAALVKDPGLDGVDIQVFVNKGTVELSGTTADRTQIDRAQKLARAAAGRAVVKSTLTPKG